MKVHQIISLLFLILLIHGNQGQLLKGSYKPFNWNSPSDDIKPMKDIAQRILEDKILQENIIQLNDKSKVSSLSQYYKIIISEIQVVSGTNIYLKFKIDQQGNQNNNKIYGIIIYMQPWTSTYKILNFEEFQDEQTNQNTTQKTQKKPSFKQDGGISDNFDINTYEQKDEIYNEIEKKLQTKNFNILDIQSQIISGVIFYLKVKNNDNNKEYFMTIISQPWNDLLYIDQFQLYEKKNNKEELINQKESQTENKTQNQKFDGQKNDQPYFVGTEQEIDFGLEEEIIKNIIFDQISGQINTKPQNIKIINATKQVVSGLKYHITFSVLDMETYECDIIVQLWNKSAVIQNIQKV